MDSPVGHNTFELERNSSSSSLKRTLSEEGSPPAKATVVAAELFKERGASAAVPGSKKRNKFSLSLAPVTAEKKSRPALSLSLGPKLPEHHIEGCANPSSKEIPKDQLSLVMELKSVDKFIKLVAIAKSLDILLTLDQRETKYSVLFYQAAKALDSIDGDMTRVFEALSYPHHPDKREMQQCCFLENIEALSREINEHLAMSPKFAFAQFSKTYLESTERKDFEKMAQAFVLEVLQFSKCYQELDGIGETQLPALFNSLWILLDRPMQQRACELYSSREGFWHIEQSIADVMGIKA